jgi:hypothetical protein
MPAEADIIQKKEGLGADLKVRSTQVKEAYVLQEHR